MSSTKSSKDWSYYWQKMITFFSACAEASNIGIVLQAVGHWSAALARLAAYGIFPYLILVTDPLIYFFRGLIRLTRLVGRTCFNIHFEEDKNGTHPWQSKAEIASLTCFALAIGFLVGMVAPPVGVTLGWIMGLAGMSVIGYFDHVWPTRQAKAVYAASMKKEGVTDEERETARKAYVVRRNGMILFMALLTGLSLLLICGSAAVFAPPVLIPALVITAKIAGAYLLTIAVGRFTTWSLSGWYQRRKAKASAEHDREFEFEMVELSSTGKMIKKGIIDGREPANEPVMLDEVDETASADFSDDDRRPLLRRNYFSTP